MLRRVLGISGELPNGENTADLRIWLRKRTPEEADATLGKGLASTAKYDDNFRLERSLTLVEELHAAQPSNDLLEAYLKNIRVDLDDSRAPSLKALAGKIQDPKRRSAMLEKLAERK